MTNTIEYPYTVRVITEDGELYSDSTTADGTAVEECQTEEYAWACFRNYEDILDDSRATFPGALTVQFIAGDYVAAEVRIEGSEL